MAEGYIDEGECPWCQAHLKFRRYGHQLCSECGNKIYVEPGIGGDGIWKRSFDDEIKRIDCRKHVEDNFSIQRMVDHYEEVFLSHL